jgi:hypothetical protein
MPRIRVTANRGQSGKLMTKNFWEGTLPFLFPRT